MTRCHTCSRPVGLADQHLFGECDNARRRVLRGAGG